MARIEVRLEENEKNAWKKHCQNLGESEANTLRKMMRLVLKDEGYNPENKVQKYSKKAVVSFRVSDEDRTKISERSALEGYNVPSQWIRSIVKSALKDDPILPDNALHALRISNKQLAAIGRNLNQIARVLNMNHSAVDALKENMIVALSATIQEHRKSVTNLIYYNADPLNTGEHDE